MSAVAYFELKALLQSMRVCAVTIPPFSLLGARRRLGKTEVQLPFTAGNPQRLFSAGVHS